MKDTEPVLTDQQVAKLLLVLREATVPGSRGASLLGFYATPDGKMETYPLSPVHVEGVFRELWTRANKVTDGTAEKMLRAYEDYDHLHDKIDRLEEQLSALRNPTPPASVARGVGSRIKDAYRGRVRTGEIVEDLDTHWRVNWGANHSKIRKDRVGTHPKKTGPWWPHESNT